MNLVELGNTLAQVPVPDVDTSGPKSFITNNLFLLLAAGGLAFVLIKMWKNPALRTLMIVLIVAVLTYWFVTNAL